jgi:pyruvate dehydrogenase E1 component beta subunit
MCKHQALVNGSNLRSTSMLITCSYAQAAALALTEAMQADDRVVALGEDIGRGGVFAQYAGLQAKFGPERVIDTPISEATMIGAGVGMALAGMRPVIEMRVVDFAICAMDEIVNQAAKNRYMFGGQGRVSMLMRLPNGIWQGSAAQHAQSLEAWFVHIPGLVVLTPSSAADNYHLFKAALASDDPVIYMEHKELWQQSGLIDTADTSMQTIGRACICREGSDLTIVGWSSAIPRLTAMVDELNASGHSIELIDLRSLWPWDQEAVLKSVDKTRRLLVVHEAVQVGGFGAEVAAFVAERSNARVARCGAPRIPVGYSPTLESESLINTERIKVAINQLLIR